MPARVRCLAPLLAAAALACGGTGSSPAASGASRTVEIRGNAGWQETGVALSAGATVTVAVTAGAITDGAAALTGGRGSDAICGSPTCCEPMPDVRRGALVARVGGITFEVGDGGTFPVTSDGPLFLRVNECDSGLEDNSGTLTVRIDP